MTLSITFRECVRRAVFCWHFNDIILNTNMDWTVKRTGNTTCVTTNRSKDIRPHLIHGKVHKLLFLTPILYDMMHI